LLVTGQILFRLGVDNRSFGSIPIIINIVLSPVVLAGLVVYGVSTVLWLYILSRMPISHAYPIMALAYPAVMILAKIVFCEDISITRWIGVAIIMFGVVLVAL